MARLRGHFLPIDVELILKLKLFYVLIEDAVFWRFDRCGIYTVKFGYYLAVQVRDFLVTGTSVGISK